MNEHWRRSAVPQAPPLTRVQRGCRFLRHSHRSGFGFSINWNRAEASYNIPAAVFSWAASRFRLLIRPSREVVRRHEVLRTTLVAEQGIPRQVIAASIGLTLELEDLSSLPEGDRHTRAVSRIREEAQRPFVLTSGPLIRARLLRLGEQEHIAVVIMHHAVSDGWSIEILIREVRALYESSLKSESSPLPELTSPVCRLRRLAAKLASRSDS